MNMTWDRFKEKYSSQSANKLKLTSSSYADIVYKELAHTGTHPQGLYAEKLVTCHVITMTLRQDTTCTTQSKCSI